MTATVIEQIFPGTPTITFQTSAVEPLESVQSQPEFADIPFIQLNQIHSDICHIVSDKSQESLDGDALLTNTPRLVLMVKTADCLPILIYHPQGVIGAVHAGRVGTQKHIIQNFLITMANTFNIDLAQTQFWFGPAICGSCYQVDEEKDLYFDLFEHNKNQIKEVLDSEPIIHSPEICTLEHPEYHSYRQNGKNAGRNWSGIMLQ